MRYTMRVLHMCDVLIYPVYLWCYIHWCTCMLCYMVLVLFFYIIIVMIVYHTFQHKLWAECYIIDSSTSYGPVLTTIHHLYSKYKLRAGTLAHATGWVLLFISQYILRAVTYDIMLICMISSWVSFSLL